MSYKIGIFALLVLGAGASCGQNKVDTSEVYTTRNDHGVLPDRFSVDTLGSTIQMRFGTPKGYNRVKVDSSSFGEYLRSLPLKAHGASVMLYDGRTKHNANVYAAVVDLPIGKRDLHQCADAVMRLRADYLWNAKRYDEIHFNFTNGFRVDYSEWMKGKRMVVSGNKTYWKQSASPSVSYSSYWKYMELIFNYAGTLSLSKELESVNLNEMKIGDVFILGGSPGHAVIVVDMCEHQETGEKKFMLAQSYMPAQEIQVLLNPANGGDDPWYSLDFSSQLRTPEWTFGKNQLKRF